MPRRQTEIIELIRQKISMSAKIVSKVDREYGYYSGASLEIASQLAMIDTILKLGLVPERFVCLLKMMRTHLDQQRKAFFASVGASELTKLGFILGEEKSGTINASSIRDSEGKA